jgi:hypothetical protein
VELMAGEGTRAGIEQRSVSVSLFLTKLSSLNETRRTHSFQFQAFPVLSKFAVLNQEKLNACLRFSVKMDASLLTG